MTENLRLMVPIVAIVMGCGIPLLGIFLDYRKRKEMFQMHHQERMAALERGIDLPPLPESFFKECSQYGKQGKAEHQPHSDLGWGLFWLLGGIATLVALYFNDKGAGSLYSLIAVAIGVHYLIYYFAVSRKIALALEREGRGQVQPGQSPS